MEKEEIIIFRETQNNGNAVHLYYDDFIGMYLAFGHSAYNSAKVLKPFLSFSDAMQMPVSLLTQKQMEELRASMEVKKPVSIDYCVIEIQHGGECLSYEKWADSVKRTCRAFSRNI